MLLLRCQLGQPIQLAEHQLSSKGAGIAAETPNCWQGITTQGTGARGIVACSQKQVKPPAPRPSDNSQNY